MDKKTAKLRPIEWTLTHDPEVRIIIWGYDSDRTNRVYVKHPITGKKYSSMIKNLQKEYKKQSGGVPFGNPIKVGDGRNDERLQVKVTPTTSGWDPYNTTIWIPGSLPIICTLNQTAYALSRASRYHLRHTSPTPPRIHSAPTTPLAFATPKEH